MKCVNCGSEVSEESQYCCGCGQPIVKEIDSATQNAILDIKSDSELTEESKQATVKETPEATAETKSEEQDAVEASEVESEVKGATDGVAESAADGTADVVAEGAAESANGKKRLSRKERKLQKQALKEEKKQRKQLIREIRKKVTPVKVIVSTYLCIQSMILLCLFLTSFIVRTSLTEKNVRKSMGDISSIARIQVGDAWIQGIPDGTLAEYLYYFVPSSSLINLTARNVQDALEMESVTSYITDKVCDFANYFTGRGEAPSMSTKEFVANLAPSIERALRNNGQSIGQGDLKAILEGSFAPIGLDQVDGAVLEYQPGVSILRFLLSSQVEIGLLIAYLLTICMILLLHFWNPKWTLLYMSISGIAVGGITIFVSLQGIELVSLLTNLIGTMPRAIISLFVNVFVAVTFRTGMVTLGVSILLLAILVVSNILSGKKSKEE